MKLLMFQASRFAFAPFERTLDGAPEATAHGALAPAAVVFVHAEAGDETRADALLRKALKNVKWIANKRTLRAVVLHSFTHLAETKADPAFAREFLEALAGRLENADYQVTLTPFGYTCEWELAVYGETIAKVFKSI